MSPEPFPDEIAQHHLHLQAGSLKIPHCTACERRQWPPRPACPACSGNHWEWVTAPATGRLFTWTVVHRTPLPAFADLAPYAVGVFDVGDGIRVIGRVVGPPSSLAADTEFAWHVEEVAGEGPQAVWSRTDTGQEER